MSCPRTAASTTWRPFTAPFTSIDLREIDAREDLGDDQAFIWLDQDNFTGAGGELRRDMLRAARKEVLRLPELDPHKFDGDDLRRPQNGSAGRAVLSREIEAGRNSIRIGSAHAAAAVALCQACVALALKVRSVRREARWRWALNVL